MSNFIVDSANIVSFPRPCSLCESMENVQKFAGLMLCGNCQENIRITNPGIFETNTQIEQKAQD
ncbi:hypothetical protein B9T25_14215 [Acinetobacter sp. ANC 4470]|uniref:hypothetical protein n=1 Tax=Acinetobacter sp. ANC 4470 TaxID=1977881 RepID=UPI000A35304B|nr:hypothetical protein [Acinetobacter sp. ANC 4470]OTG62954.1 hypothetical protein B9T25_14215 [Acinetobacter sp. ANC 4470]